MKPRIRLSYRIWCCYLPDWQRTNRMGMGYTPKEAYADWEAAA